MGLMRVNKLIYEGDKYYFESNEFDKNIILIEGDNGTGKSTFCNLIYFALGGEVPIFRRSNNKRHDEITSDSDNYVDLYISINNDNYLLRRYFEDNEITIIPYKRVVEEIYSEDEKTLLGQKVRYVLSKDRTEIYPVYRSKDTYVFSDWILGKLEISVVELFHGYNTFKINISDLMRLIYHDQQPNPEGVYKKPDTNSTYVSDSELVRKAIFELLVGKAYSEYYDSIVEEKKLTREKSLAKEVVSQYTLLADKMRENGEAKNVSFLQKDISDKELQIEKLHEARMAFKRNRSGPSTINQDIESYKSELIDCELNLSRMKQALISALDERYKLNVVRSESASEIKRIEKVIFSHDQLNLFTSDTCPYCLSHVDRAEGHCVCGASIEEEQYERFFYTSKEYKDILKAKIKALSTTKIAYDDCDSDVQEIKKEIESIEKNIVVLREKLKDMLERVDEIVDIESLNNIDDKILQLREDVAKLNRLLEIESKLARFQKDFDLVSSKAKDAELKRKGLEVKAQQDVTSKVNAFSKKYDELMKNTLPDCRSAKITLDNYLPSINDGLYRETSSLVSIRLMYFITLMHLALSDKSVTFPRFLLIDTPETAGIELDNLVNCIHQLEELQNYGEDFQVIISTGLKKYPESLKDNRVLFMPDKQKEHMLLKRKNFTK
ncbi:MAG: AAA family ATPase [Halomonas sp.]|uniref:AAA family ATPase n=1 Tax=Halomonas sp. TaxID=1486246 RepID=UPI003F923644